MTLSLPAHIQAFLQPEAYPHPTQFIELLQTHISWVLLTGAFAYKFKKPVNFGFLDFSSLPRRKFYCEQELRLNRRLAPDLYLEVSPVYAHAGAFSLTPTGDIVDYAVKMVQFDPSDLLDRHLNAGSFQAHWMDSLAHHIAQFHQHAEVVPPSSTSHATLLAEHIRENLRIAEQQLNHAVSRDELAKLNDFAKRELADQAEHLQWRGKTKHIRHCHGDLHLKNITLFRGKPTLFDCIEFNDDFRLIDTMNDVAFLLMDCDAHDRADLGFRFLSVYLESNPDIAGLHLLPLYLFYRAGVRGKVACMLADEQAEADRAPHWSEAQHYFHLALRYSQKNSPKLFAVGGFSGSGKSHLARLGCGMERAIILRSDAIRFSLHTQKPEEARYSTSMSQLTYQTMFDQAKAIIAAGFSVILDATFLHPQSRHELLALSEALKVPLHFFWLNVASDTLQKRVAERSAAGDDISEADLRVLKMQLQHHQPPCEPWIQQIATSDHWPNHTSC